MTPQDVDERRVSANQINKGLERFLFRTMVLLCIQSMIVSLLVFALYMKRTEAYGITQSGEVFKLKEKK